MIRLPSADRLPDAFPHLDMREGIVFEDLVEDSVIAPVHREDRSCATWKSQPSLRFDNSLFDDAEGGFTVVLAGWTVT